MDATRIGAKLKQLRGNRTQEEVADAVGISRSAYNMYELGQRIPCDEIKILLARYFGTTVDDLFFAQDSHET